MNQLVLGILLQIRIDTEQKHQQNQSENDVIIFIIPISSVRFFHGIKVQKKSLFS